ncbi:myc box-dependent-interacting protein 1-like isoform X2 [Anneissia japonica]|uniref:myc box-dependent-interacting protein 1-like isoform X2 n=1 Tax=Anneissia japonica TaxID=1529436 RepID=UPI00142559E7|nr:myc box-dependent-interacting protein 1-like isoform X2 [Anneissia japonica]
MLTGFRLRLFKRKHVFPADHRSPPYKVLQKLGKADETKDQMFEMYVQNFALQVSAANRLQKELKRYIECVKSMSTATRGLHEALESIYEQEWDGYGNISSTRETSDLLWDDYQNRLVEQVFNPLLSYQSRFPEVKRRIEKRGRKLIDFDSARHALETSKNKKDEAKAAKAQEHFDMAKTSYEDINNELLDELPNLYDSRIPFYASTFQLVCSAEGVFHTEIGKTRLHLNSIMDKLYEEAGKGTYNVSRSNIDAGMHAGMLPTSPTSIGSEDSNNKMFSMAATPSKTMEVPKPDPPQYTAYDDDDDDNDDDSQHYQVPPHHAVQEDLDEGEYQHPPPARPNTNQTDVTSNQNGGIPPGVLYKVVAVHDYAQKDDDELSFSKGDVILVVNYDDPEDEEDGWLMGRIENTDSKGIFPENFTQRLKS